MWGKKCNKILQKGWKAFDFYVEDAYLQEQRIWGEKWQWGGNDVY